MCVCMCFYYGVFTTGVKAPVPEGTTNWRCACKEGVPDIHLAFVLTKFSQFRGKTMHFILMSMYLAREYSLGTLFFTSLTGDGTTILRGCGHPSNAKV